MTNSTIQNDFAKIHDISRQAKVLSGISHILEWDQETYMPPKGAEIRAEQLKTIAGIIHAERTGKKFALALSKLIDLDTGKEASGLNAAQKAALREWRRDYRKDTAIPRKFVEEFTDLTCRSLEVWRSARKDNEFRRFAPYLEKIIDMSRKRAELLGYDDHPYDALLDLYEPYAKTKHVAKMFDGVQKAVTKLLKKISGKTVDDSFLHGKFAQDKQLDFANQILEAMGYDKERGRLDIWTHPFSSSSHPNDSRITTRIHPTSLISNIFVALHEGGHALYEMGLPVEQYGTPLGEAISLGMHESQSRWWETRIGGSKAFWKHWLPLLQKQFKGKLDSVTLDQFYKAINKVEPSFIRVEADEVTYPLHVVLRFQLEVALIEGTLKVKDIPEAWNAKMNEFLHITPAADTQGCLQDIHWSMGSFGYFPTYTLGNMYASHLFLGFEKQHKDWEDRISKGELSFIREWLLENIHKHGRMYTSQDLLNKVTGKPFSADAYIQYLEGKYLG